jgi:uncharacterized repeat protein (TIGR01451 family)
MKPAFISLLFFALCSPVLFAQINWESTHGPEGGSAQILPYNDQYVFYPDFEFLYRTADGVNWEKLPFVEPRLFTARSGSIAAIKITADQYFNYYATLRVSHDNGVTWLTGTVPGNPANIYYGTMAAFSQGIYLADDLQNTIYRTLDDGLTWDVIPSPGSDITKIWVFDDRLIACIDKQYYRLAANGTTWDLVSPVFNPQEKVFTQFATGSNLLYGTNQNLWISNDNGITWINKPMPAFGTNFVLVGSRLYYNTSDYSVWYSDDFGQNWTKMPNHVPSVPFAFGTIAGKLLYAANDKGVFVLDAATNQFKPDNAGLESGTSFDMIAHNDTIWTAGPGGLFNYNRTTKQWSDVSGLPTTLFYYLQVSAGKTGKIATIQEGSDSIYVSPDNGATWNVSVAPTIFAGKITPAKTYWLDDILIVVGHEGAARSTDYGLSWTTLSTAADFVAAFNGKYYGIVYGGTGILSTSDLGLTWQTEPAPSNTGTAGIYTTGDRLFLQTEYYLYTTTNGINWKYASDGLPNIDFHGSLYQESYVYETRIWNKSGKYYYHEPSVGFFVSLDTCKTWLPIQDCTRSIMTSIDTNFYLTRYDSGVLKTGIPQQYGSISAGKVFKDDNNNGLLDPGELVLPNMTVSMKEPGAWYPYWFTTTRQDGHYSLGSTPGGIDTMRVIVPSNYVANVNPPQYLVTGNGASRDFGVHFIPNVTDVQTSGGYGGRPRPGKDLSIYLDYLNAGTVPASGTLSIKLDPAFHFTSATPAPASMPGPDSLVWNFNQMPLFDHQFIRVDGYVDQNATAGNPLLTSGYAHTDLPDSIPANNQFVLNDTIVNSYDPNQKRVEPADGLTAAEIASGKEILYTIQFQNTGTAAADRVRITDHLDTALNVKTLRLVSSSHPVSGFQLLPGGLLEIVFDQIGLPDSTTSEAGSHGFVTFAIQRYKSYGPYFRITNKAAIYFDFNDPIITNTVVTTLVTPVLAISEPTQVKSTKIGLTIVPNPAQQYFTAKIKGKATGSGQLYIQNPAGQVCYEQQVTDLSREVQIDCSRLTEGVYVVRVVGKEGVWMGEVVVVR